MLSVTHCHNNIANIIRWWGGLWRNYAVKTILARLFSATENPVGQTVNVIDTFFVQSARQYNFGKISVKVVLDGVHFCATSFQLFTTSSSAVGAPPAENTLGHYKWRRPSSKIRDFCELDIFSTALLLCSKLQLESLFGKDHLTGREMISAHICHPRPRWIANQILSPLSV